MDHPDLGGLFVEESSKYLRLLEDGSASLEAGGPPPGALRDLVRYAHCLKGMAATMGFPEIEREAARIEAALAGGAARPGLRGEILSGLSRIRRLVGEFGGGRAAPSGRPVKEAARVLLVEDAAVISRMVSFRLEKSGFEVSTAPDGEAALAALGGAVPDVILLDMSLPGMDGAELCRILKADARFRSVPVVLFTASPRAGELRAQTGADAVIGKPFDPAEMIGTIRRLAGRGRGAP